MEEEEEEGRGKVYPHYFFPLYQAVNKEQTREKMNKLKQMEMGD